MSAKCIKCNCDSRNYIFKIYRVIRQFLQNKVVKMPEKLQYAVSVSKFSDEILKKYFNNTKIYQISNPIEIIETKNRIEAEKNKLYVFLGRISKEKGINEFCKAVTESKVAAVVIGDGELRKKLEDQYPNIQFVGWKNSNEILDYLNKARCVLFTSLWYETMGLTAVEALNYGIPVICSSGCAATDYVINFKNGLIFENGRVEDLVKKIALSRDDEQIRSWSINAYLGKKKKNFEKSYYRDELLRLYTKILEE